MRFSDILSPEMLTLLDKTIETKASYTFQNIFIRAIFANFFINITLVIAMQIDDIFAKMFVMMFGVTIFAFMGYEHVIYNACLFVGGLFYQTESLALVPALKNIVAAFLGNYVGGGLIIGLFYAYLNDHGQFRAHRIK